MNYMAWCASYEEYNPLTYSCLVHTHYDYIFWFDSIERHGKAVSYGCVSVIE
jgi:hypothetical protein